MKKLFLILCLILTPSLAFASGYCGAWGSTGGGTSPWTVSSDAGGTASAAYADVNACVNTTAAAGETVLVPTASATWSSTLTITKSLTLTGAGTGCPDACVDNTTLTSDGSTLLIKVDVTADVTLDISGFYLNANGHTRALQFETDVGVRVYNFRFHHNKIANGSEYTVAIYGHWWGLIDNNYFTDNDYNFKVLNCSSQACDNYAWDNYAGVDNLGSVHYLYIESNIFNNVGTWVNTSGNGTRWVFRHNTVNDSGLYWMHDVHGDTSNRGVVAVEIYENTYDFEGGAAGLVDFRGGTGIIFNNTENNYAGWGARIRPREELNYCSQNEPGTCSGSVTATCDTGGPAYDVVNNSYFWANTQSASMEHQSNDDPYGCIDEDTE